MFCRNPHTLPPEKVLEHLQAGSRGLTSEDAKKRLKVFGKNTLKEEKISYLKIFFRQFNNLMIYVLILAALISLFAGKFVDFWVISFLLVINSVVGFWQELKAEISIQALKKMTESQDKVFRDNKSHLKPSSELVPGDVVLLFEGAVVAADMRLLVSSSLMVDEASLTGESMPVDKEAHLVLKEETPIYEQKNMLFTGTTVVKGTARAVVVNTGPSTYFASIAQKAKEASPDTPLTKALKMFTKRYTLFLIVLLFGLGIFAVYKDGISLNEAAYILLAQLVSAVPEGLPIVITLVLVLGAMNLSKKKTLIRHLPSVETLGSATIIASDKTGTITTGNIKVEKVFALDEQKLKTVALLCNDAEAGKGDAVDVALASWIPDYEEERLKYARVWSYGFDANLRLMALACEINGEKKLLIKGAYEELRKFATNKEDFELLDEKHNLFSSWGLRLLAFGMGDFTSPNSQDWKIQLVGLIGFLDPPKESTLHAVNAAKEAGLRVVMMTGDFPLTAKTVAEKVGIYHENDLVLTGDELVNLKPSQMTKVLKKATVFARILPEHKYRLVKELQKRGEIVAVSGDGVNDVPALKAADLGIAMGSGTEAAKSVAKMIITDSDLKIIVDAIRGGRIITANTRKVLYYLLSTSLLEIFLISFAILSNLPLPLMPIQILWINLVTDGVQDKTFPFAREEWAVMRKRPSSSFFDFSQMSNILFFALSIGFTAFLMFRFLLDHYSYELASSITFTAVAAVQWGNGIQAQKEKEPFFKNIKRSFLINPYIYLAVVLGLGLQLLAVYGISDLLHVAPLPLEAWKYPLFLAVLGFFLVEGRKWLEMLYRRLFKKA